MARLQQAVWQRQPQFAADVGRAITPAFGVDEFLDFVQQVDGQAIYTLNLVGPPGQRWQAEQIRDDVLSLMQYVYQTGQGSRILFWELGNELDLGNYTPASYASLYRYLRSAIDEYFGRTAFRPQLYLQSYTLSPADASANVALARWDRPLLRELGTLRPDGVAFHGYYDGGGGQIPAKVSEIAQVAALWGCPVAVTEYAVWCPHPEVAGTWPSTWQGAAGLAAVDFQIACMSNRVVAACYHSLQPGGPFKLFSSDAESGAITPNPVYYGLKAVRFGYRDSKLTVDAPYAPAWSGAVWARPYPYARAFAMQDSASGLSSLIAFNRSNGDYALKLDWAGVNPDGVLQMVLARGFNDQAEGAQIDTRYAASQLLYSVKKTRPRVRRGTRSNCCSGCSRAVCSVWWNSTSARRTHWSLNCVYRLLLQPAAAMPTPDFVPLPAAIFLSGRRHRTGRGAGPEPPVA